MGFSEGGRVEGLIGGVLLVPWRWPQHVRIGDLAGADWSELLWRHPRDHDANSLDHGEQDAPQQSWASHGGHTSCNTTQQLQHNALRHTSCHTTQQLQHNALQHTSCHTTHYSTPAATQQTTLHQLQHNKLLYTSCITTHQLQRNTLQHTGCRQAGRRLYTRSQLTPGREDTSGGSTRHDRVPWVLLLAHVNKGAVNGREEAAPHSELAAYDGSTLAHCQHAACHTAPVTLPYTYMPVSYGCKYTLYMGYCVKHILNI